MSAPWITTLATVAEQLNAHRIEWMLLGSAATALRGAAIVPGDIDIAMRAAEDVTRAAAALPTPDARGLDSPGPDEPEVEESGQQPAWFSTTAEPALRFDRPGEQWTFGLWMIGGIKVELAHIDAPAVAGLMIEARSPLVWEERETLDCRGHRVPTVPVEVQLATMVARRQESRIEATIAAVHVSRLNLPLLRRAISDRRSEVPDMTIPDSLQRLLAHTPTAPE
jgi:hypothetical protein